MDEGISYKSLRKIQEIEKNSPMLSELYTDFYSDLFNHITQLDKRLEKESSSQKEILLNEEADNIKKISLKIYEQREKKILLASISKARGGNPILKNMLNDEEKLFSNVLEILVESRKNIIEQRSKKNKIDEEINTQRINDKVEEEHVEVNNSNSNPVLLIKQNMPDFIGTDTKSYNLRKNDIVSMPEDMCEMLVKRGKAERINW